MNAKILKLTKNWVLTQRATDDRPILLNREDGNVYQAEHIVCLYPSWGFQPARTQVRKAAKMRPITREVEAMVSSFCGWKERADTHVTIRTTKKRKEEWIRKAQHAGMNLSEWINKALEKNK